MAHLDTDPATWLLAGAQSVHAFAGDLTRVGSDDLAVLAASVAAMAHAVSALQAAVALEADERGVIAASDNPRPAAWVEQVLPRRGRAGRPESGPGGGRGRAHLLDSRRGAAAAGGRRR